MFDDSTCLVDIQLENSVGYPRGTAWIRLRNIKGILVNKEGIIKKRYRDII